MAENYSSPNLPTKQCSQCHTEYPATREYFYYLKSGKNGLHPWCKRCCVAANKIYHEKNRKKREEYAQKYRDEHREQRMAYDRAYYAANKEHITQRNRKYVVAHKQRTAEYTRLWRAANRDKERAHSAMRRALKRANGGSYSDKDIQQLQKNQKNRCYYCQCKLVEYHVDHIVPLSRGGSNDPSNLVLACPTCNISKRDKLPHEWSKGGRLL